VTTLIVGINIITVAVLPTAVAAAPAVAATIERRRKIDVRGRHRHIHRTPPSQLLPSSLSHLVVGSVTHDGGSGGAAGASVTMDVSGQR